MKRDELKQLLQGPMTAFPHAYNAAGQVDTGATADLVRWAVHRGMVAGKTIVKVTSGGEGTDLDDDEWPRVVAAAVAGAAGRVPVACGIKPADTAHVIAAVRRAQDLGASAVQLDTPFFHFPTQDDMLRFFTAVSNAVDCGIIIMNSFWFGAPSLAAATLLGLAGAEQVAAVKWAVPDGEDYDAMCQFAHLFNVIDNAGDPVRSHRNGARGYVDSTLLYDPAHAFKVWDCLEAHRYDEAAAELAAVNRRFGRFAASAAAVSGGNRVGRAVLELMGHPIGPPRPPVVPLSGQEQAELRELMASLGWPLAAA